MESIGGQEPTATSSVLEESDFPSWLNIPETKLANIKGRDTRDPGYVDPMVMTNMFATQEEKDSAFLQALADSKFTEQLQKESEPLIQAQKEEEIIRQDEIRKRTEAERQELIQSPDFETALSSTDSDAIKMNQRDAANYFTNLYGKYGFVFREAGIAGINKLEVLAPNGETEEIDLMSISPLFSNKKQADKLRSFISANAQKPEEPINADEQTDIDNAIRARKMRKTPRIDKDGTQEAFNFEVSEQNGKYLVYPTLFPRTETDRYNSDPFFWEEKQGTEAYQHALKRGEVFEFSSKEKAEEFADGSWEDVNTFDAEAKTFFGERGLDYNSYKKQYDRYEEVVNTLEILEDANTYYQSELAPEERERLSAYYVNGRKREDVDNVIDELKEEASTLRDFVNDSDFREVREDFDLYIEKRFQQVANDASKVNYEARNIENDADTEALSLFGVRAEDLGKITPADEQQKKTIDSILTSYKQSKALSQEAADKYELANTWFSAKADKNIRDEFVENYAAVSNLWEQGWSNGKAGNAILAIALGLEDIDDEKSVERLSLELINYLEQAQTGKMGRAESRFHSARGWAEMWDVIKDDPLELAIGWAANSMSQMLPYGWKIIAGSTATGAATGAGVGVAAGGVGAIPGALTGAAWGLRSGFAASSLALEYTNAVLDAAREKYNLNDPEQVKNALQDEEVWRKGREIGLKRGLSIAAVDMLSSGLAGRVFKTTSIASKGRRIVSGAAERLTFDPIMEGVGEFAAIKVAGQKLDSKEIIMEIMGGFGSNTSTSAVNVYLDGRTKNNIKIANDLADINKITSERASDSRILSWAGNMRKLGQITPEQEQRIIENVGLRRESREILSVGTKGDIFGRTGNNKLETRLSQLLAARKELSSTPNRQSVFSKKISEINDEISEIATTKKLRPAEQQTVLAGQGVISAREQESGVDIREGIKKYAINGEQVTREQFLARIDKMTPRRLLKTTLTVDNDEEVSNNLKEKINAIQKPSTTQVDVQEQTADGGTLGERDTETEVTETETKKPKEKVVLQPKTIEQLEEENKQTLPKVRTSNIFLNEQETLTREDRKGVDEVIENDKVSELPDETISVADIVPTQKNVTIPNLKDTQDVTDVAPEEAIIVTEKDGKFYVIDGHHRLGNEILKGNSDVTVKVFREEKAELTELEKQEAEDLRAFFDNDADPQFQLDVQETSEEKKQQLVKSATKLMEQVQPEIQEEALIFEKPDPATIYPITIKENTELANKVRRMGLSELIGKKINLVMADQLKVDEKRMGGPFFPLQDGLFGLVAWASIDKTAAMSIARGAVNADFSVVFNMSPSAVDSNVVLLDTLIDKVKQSPNRTQLFQAMVSDIQGKKYGKKTDLVHKIASEAKNIDEFSKGFSKLDVKTKAKIFKDVLPSRDVKASTEVGVLFQSEGISQESIREENVEQFVSDLPMGALTMVLQIQDRQGNPVTESTIEEAIITPKEQKERGLKKHKNYPFYLRGTAIGLLSETTPFWNVNKRYRDIIDLKIQGTIKEKENYTVNIDGKNRTVKVSNNPNGTRTIELMNSTREQIVDERITIPKNTKTKTETIIRNTFGDVVKVSNIDQRITSSQARAAAMRSAMMSASSAIEVSEPTASRYEQFIKRLSNAFPNVEVMTDQAAFDDLVRDLNAKKLATKNQKIYGAVYNGRLYLNPSLENYNTPIHEFGHIWMNVSKEINPEAYNRGIDLINVKDSDYVSQIENNKEYQRVIKQMRKDGMSEQDIRNYILEEALATAIGDKGESFATAAQERNFKNWLNELFEFVKKLTGISKLSPQQLQDINLDEFLQAVVVDLMSENQLFKDAEVKGLSNELQLMTSSPNPSIDSIVSKARDFGFSDNSIRTVLKEKGYRDSDITKALKIKIDLYTPMPKAFGNIEEGATVGLEFFNRVKEKINRFSTEGPRGVKGTTRTKTFAEIREKAQEILENDPTYQAQVEQIQKELSLGLDRVLGIRTNPNVSKQMSEIRNSLKERKISENNIADAQRRMRTFIRQVLPKSNDYSNTSINKLISIVNATRTDNFKGQVELVLAEVDKQRQVIKNQLIDKIQKIAESKAKIAMTSSKRRRSAGVDAIGQAYFAEVKKVLRLVKKNDIAGLVALQNEVNEDALSEAMRKAEAGEKITRQERALIDKQLALDTFSDVMNMQLEEVNQLLTEVRNTRAESIARLNNRREARRKAIEAIKGQFDTQIENDYSELYDENGNPKNGRQRQRDAESIRESFEDKGILKGFQNLFSKFKRNNKYNANQMQKFLYNTVLHLGTFANILDRGKKGMFTKVFYDQLNDMDEKNLQGVFEQEDNLDAITSSAVGKRWRKWKYTLGTDVLTLKGIKNTKTNAEYTESLNRDQAMTLYALSLNPTQRMLLEKQAFDDAKMERIKNFIGPEGVAIAEQVVDYFSNEYYNSLNDVYVQANDVNLGYIVNYFPTQSISTEGTKQDMLSGDFSKVFTADTSPSLQERTNKENDIMIGASFTEVVENYIQGMERYKAYALGVKQMNEVYKSESIQALLDETGLAPIFRQMLNYAINPNSGPKIKDGVISWVQRQFTSFVLAFKPIQFIKQTTSFVTAYEKYRLSQKRTLPVADLLGFMTDYAYVVATLPKQIKEAKEVSATFKNRLRSGLEGDVFGLESGGRTYKRLKQQQGLRGMLARGFASAKGAFTVAGDIMGVLGYKAVYNRAIKNGMPKAEALSLFNSYNETQQTRRTTEKAAIQQDQRFWSKFFAMFGSTLILQMNKTYQSVNNITNDIDLKKGKVGKASDYRSLALNLSVANALFTMASYSGALIKGDKDDRDKAWRAVRDAALGLNLLYQIPLLGTAAEYSINKMKGERMPSSEGVNPFMSVVRKIEKSYGQVSDGDVIRATRPILEFVIGTQFDSPIGLFNLMSTEGDDEDFYDALGITPSYRPGYGDNTKTNSEKKKGMTKTDMKEYMPDLYEDIYGGDDVMDEVRDIKKEIRDIKKEIKDDIYK